MGLFNMGAKAIEDAVTEKKSFKDTFITLKKGESVKVRVMSKDALISYKAHSSFEKKIYTTPCVKPLGQECILCKVSNSGVDGFDGLYAKERYIVALGDMESGTIKYFEMAKKVAQMIIDQTNEYEDMLSNHYFTLKRTGDKADYTLAIAMKFKGSEEDQFKSFDGIIITEEMFEAVVTPKDPQYILEALDLAGFPVHTIEPNYMSRVVDEAPSVNTGAVIVSDEGDSSLPF